MRRLFKSAYLKLFVVAVTFFVMLVTSSFLRSDDMALTLTAEGYSIDYNQTALEEASTAVIAGKNINVVSKKVLGNTILVDKETDEIYSLQMEGNKYYIVQGDSKVDLELKATHKEVNKASLLAGSALATLVLSPFLLMLVCLYLDT